MSSVGIIANTASGRDIRRLVAHASVFGNSEKVNILQRVLLALEALGVDDAIIMPDGYGIGLQALDGLRLTSLRASILDMAVTGTDRDSTEAARHYSDMKVGCLVVLGGDGTNRVVAKGCGAIPIASISTGTNNVFPAMVEGTIAGMAAGLLAMGVVDVDEVTYRAKRLEVYFGSHLVDIALVDVVTSSDLWVGTRAIWDLARVHEIVLARAEPGNIGISSIGCCFQPLGSRDGQGMYLELGPEGVSVLAPVAPGLVTPVAVRAQRVLSVDESVDLDSNAKTLALDGEREIEIYDQRAISVRLTRNGPRVVDIPHCMEVAARSGVFNRPASSSRTYEVSKT